MVVRTQQTGVSPETTITCSHMLTFRGVNGGVGSIHLNQDARSSSRNVFQRLSSEANLRDTLNKRHD